MKHLKHFFTTLLLLCSIIANAQKFSVDGIYYCITDETNKTVEVTYTGEYSYNRNNYTGNVVIPENVVYNGNVYIVNRIGYSAFRGCSTLTSVEIPNGVTSIDSYAFYGSSNLERVEIPNSVTRIEEYAFENCSALADINVPENIEYIGYKAFYNSLWYNNCPDGLMYFNKMLYTYKGVMPEKSSIIVQDGTLSIVEGAFRDCNELKSITIPNSVTDIGHLAFYWCTGLTHIELPQNITTIPGGMLQGCTSLPSIYIPSSVKCIEGESFDGCDALKDVYISDLAAWCNIEMHYTPFIYAENLYLNDELVTELVIPDEIVEIKSMSFYGCNSLESVKIPESVTKIQSGALGDCSGLKNIYCYAQDVPNAVDAFYGTELQNITLHVPAESIEEYKSVEPWKNFGTIVAVGEENNTVTIVVDGITYSISKITKEATVIAGETKYTGDIVIPETVIYDNITYDVTRIGENAFEYCWGVTTVTLPNSIIEIGKYAFYVCSGLKNINIPEGVKSIKEWTFYECSNLSRIIIPNSVVEIGDNSFCCLNLKTVINFSDLLFFKASSDYGSITEFADRVINAPKGELIGDYVFYTSNNKNYLAGYCGNETEITFPENYKGEYYDIAHKSFDGYPNIVSIAIPYGVTAIWQEAFCKCTSLKEIVLPSTLTKIYGGAFCEGTELTDIYCYATTVPDVQHTFGNSTPEIVTLHVPAVSMELYKAAEYWKDFGTIIPLDSEEVVPEVKICATPIVTYQNEELIFDCETKGAEFVTTVINNYSGTYGADIIKLPAIYNISVYAEAAGYKKSETVNVTLYWVETLPPTDNSNGVDIISIPATPVLITSTNGLIMIECKLEKEPVRIYDSSGMPVAVTYINEGVATIQTNLSKGSVAIVKIGDRSIKVVVG